MRGEYIIFHPLQPRHEYISLALCMISSPQYHETPMHRKATTGMETKQGDQDRGLGPARDDEVDGHGDGNPSRPQR